MATGAPQAQQAGRPQPRANRDHRPAPCRGTSSGSCPRASSHQKMKKMIEPLLPSLPCISPVGQLTLGHGLHNRVERRVHRLLRIGCLQAGPLPHGVDEGALAHGRLGGGGHAAACGSGPHSQLLACKPGGELQELHLEQGGHGQAWEGGGAAGIARFEAIGHLLSTSRAARRRGAVPPHNLAALLAIKHSHRRDHAMHLQGCIQEELETQQRTCAGSNPTWPTVHGARAREICGARALALCRTHTQPATTPRAQRRRSRPQKGAAARPLRPWLMAEHVRQRPAAGTYASTPAQLSLICAGRRGQGGHKDGIPKRWCRARGCRGAHGHWQAGMACRQRGPRQTPVAGAAGGGQTTAGRRPLHTLRASAPARLTPLPMLPPTT